MQQPSSLSCNTVKARKHGAGCAGGPDFCPCGTMAAGHECETAVVLCAVQINGCAGELSTAASWDWHLPVPMAVRCHCSEQPCQEREAQRDRPTAWSVKHHQSSTGASAHARSVDARRRDSWPGRVGWGGVG